MKQSDIGLIESLNEEVDKIIRHGCIVPRVEMGTKDFLDTIAIINRQKAEIERLQELVERLKAHSFKAIDNPVEEMTEGNDEH